MAKMNALSEDEMLKLKAVVLYVLNKCEELDYFHLFKILYFADKEHYAKYGRRIIQDIFCALPKGPVPSILFDAIKVASGQTKAGKYSSLCLIADSLEVPDPSYYFILTAKELPDMDELSESDIELLDKSIAENKDLSFSELSAKSHDLAWESAWNKSHNSAIDDILMAKAAGANDDMIEYIEENKLIKALIGA
jgi:uncharacterized phage-associated protein